MSSIQRRFFIALAFAFAALGSCKGGSHIDTGKKTENNQAEFVVFYEANPRIFAPSKSIEAISDRLESIKELGVDVLWLMPIHEQGIKNGIGSPYCVKDYKSVKASYGTLNDLKLLVSKAKGLGIRVIMDWVANHTSWDNLWITEHRDWYTQDTYGNIISPPGTGWTDVAELNFDNKAMRKAMIEAMVFWIKEAGVDGYRCDYVDGVPADFWEEAIEAIRAEKKDALMLAESSNKEIFKSGFDYIYGWPYQDALVKLFSGEGFSDFIAIVKDEAGDLPQGKNIMRFITNHDKASEKSPINVYGGKQGALAAHVITSFIGGAPLIYSSQEIGYDRALSFFNDNIMEWSCDADYTKSYQNVMKAASATASIRSEGPVFYSTGKVVSIFWKNGKEGLFVLVNTENAKANLRTPIERVGDEAEDLISGTKTILPESIDIGAYEYYIWKIK